MSKITSIQKEKLKSLPIGVMATLLALLTLSNIFATLGFNLPRHIVVNFGVLVIFAGILKLIIYPKQVLTELQDTLFGSLYPTFCMSIMLMSAYYVTYNYTLGKTMWLVAITLNILIILIYTYSMVVKKQFNYAKFLPPFWVAYVGIIVSVITSPAMNAPGIAKPIFYFSTVAYFIILPFMLYRLFTKPVADLPYPTLAVMAAPPSLLVVAYTTLFKSPNLNFTLLCYVLVVVMVIYMFSKFSKIFSLKFVPTFAGITFPLAISTLATMKMSALLESNKMSNWANFLREVSSIQLIIACAGISFVAYNFAIAYANIFKSDDAESKN